MAKKRLDVLVVKNCTYSRQKSSQAFQCVKSLLAGALTLCPRMTGNHTVPAECPHK